MNATTSAITGATAMSFNYPNFPGNETQYLAILQNGAYQIPIHVHVGARITYRGTYPQDMPLFNGSILFFLNVSSFIASGTTMNIHTDTTKPTGSSKSKYF
ncbi:hypothetical protein Peur_039633 [Populus x canadensis]|jgi:hypothetical protein